MDKYGDLSRGKGLTQQGREQGIRRLMSINLLKRLESSVYSFRLTLDRIRALIDDGIRPRQCAKMPEDLRRGCRIHVFRKPVCRAQRPVGCSIDKRGFIRIFHRSDQQSFGCHVPSPSAFFFSYYHGSGPDATKKHSRFRKRPCFDHLERPHKGPSSVFPYFRFAASAFRRSISRRFSSTLSPSVM